MPSWEHIKQLIDLICKKHTVRPSERVLSRFTLSQQWAEILRFERVAELDVSPLCQMLGAALRERRLQVINPVALIFSSFINFDH